MGTGEGDGVGAGVGATILRNIVCILKVGVFIGCSGGFLLVSTHRGSVSF